MHRSNVLGRMGDHMRSALILIGLSATLMWASSAGAVETAGVVQFVAGDVKLVSPPGAGRAARKGVPVFVGDTVHTGADALAQLKMGDGAIVVVQPGSDLTVAEFHFDDRTPDRHNATEMPNWLAVAGHVG